MNQHRTPDDALYAEVSEEGWNLYVAIADPTSYIAVDSGLDRDVAARATSIYFHGDVLPMLPEELSQDTCALSEGADRPALVCKSQTAPSGSEQLTPCAGQTRLLCHNQPGSDFACA